MIVKFFQAAFRPHITHMVAKVYIPTLFPLTFLISLTAIYVDQYLGFENGFLSSPFNYYLSGIMFVVGVILWIWTYEQLTRLGEGSPSPAAGRTIKLAQEGIYATVESHLFGINRFVAVGVTFAFFSSLLPFLCGSLMEKVIRQDHNL